MAEWSLYLIRCSDGKLYTGITTDVERRFGEHGGQLGAKFMRGKGPFKLAYSASVGDRSLASRLEWRVKRLAKRDKERLVNGEFTWHRLVESPDNPPFDLALEKAQ